MAATKRPGLRDGVQSELLVIADVKPGHGPALREALTRETTGGDEARREGTRLLGTVHNFRNWLIDNDTRWVFASVFDGSWDDYIDDFGVSTFFTDAFNNLLQHVEGYKIWHDPSTKDWLVAHQVTAIQFTSAYPDLTVKQIWKQQRAYDALQAVLDTPEFQAALKNPANAALVATPAFQKLLDEAAS